MKHYILITIFVLTSCASKEIQDDTGNTPDFGYVKLLMDIDEFGMPINLKIIESHPAGVFDKKALITIKKQKFKPKYLNGVAVVQYGLRYTMEFKATDE